MSKKYKTYAYIGVLSAIAYIIGRALSNPYNYTVEQNLTLLPSYILGIISIWGIRTLALQHQNKALAFGIYVYICLSVLRYLDLYFHFYESNILIFGIAMLLYALMLLTMGIGHYKLSKHFGNLTIFLGSLYILNLLYYLLVSMKSNAFLFIGTNVLVVILLFKASSQLITAKRTN